MDHHVPSAITQGLRKRAVDVLTAEEDGRSQSDDESLFARATQLGRVLFTSDRDLLDIAYRWLREGVVFCGLVYAHQLQVSIGTAIRDLEIIAKVADPNDLENVVLRLPL
jgi:predicted nuclease of predicted toxin-antitoxin system